MRKIAYSLTLCLAMPAMAQDDSGGLLEGLLESSLSDQNRQISVTGLTGALSSKASIESITIADEDGIWLTIRNAELDWSRLALVRGDFLVNELSAEEIIVTRAPKPAPQELTLPSPEAQPFALPELPVSVNIGKIAIGTLNLGEALVGEEAQLTFDGALSLADGALRAEARVARLDRESDRLDLLTGYDNETRQITLDLRLAEAKGGLVSTTLGLPGAPSLLLRAEGVGPVDDFTADLTLASDNAPRLSGRVALRGVGDGAIAFDGDLGGDIRALMIAPYRPFFGESLTLDLAGQSSADGVRVDRMSLSAALMQLNGNFAMNEAGRIEALRLRGGIRDASGAPVLLPLAGASTFIDSADFDVALSDPKGETWRADLSVNAFEQPDTRFGIARLSGRGTLDQSDGMQVAGAFDLELDALDLSDPALARAAGQRIAAKGDFDWQASALRLIGIDLDAGDVTGQITTNIKGLESGLEVSGEANLTLGNLARFADISGMDLGGRITTSLSGTATPLSGAFDLTASATAQDLSTGIAQLDPLLTGQSQLQIEARRDETGTELPRLTLTNPAVEIDAQGRIGQGSSALTLQARLDDLARSIPALPGPASLTADLTQNGAAFTGTAQLRGPKGIHADLDATRDGEGQPRIRFDGGLDQLGDFVAQLPGALRATGRAEMKGDSWQIDTTLSANAGASADVSGQINMASQAMDLALSTTLNRLERFVPQLPGTVTSRTRLTGDFETPVIISTLRAPKGIGADLEARITSSTADMALTYRATLEQLAEFVPQLSGALTVNGRANRSANRWAFDVATDGSADLNSQIDGRFDETSGALDLSYDATLARAGRLAPQLAGNLRARGDVSRADQMWRLTTQADGVAGLSAQATVTYGEADGALRTIYQASLETLSRFVPGLTGQLELSGTAEGQNGIWSASAKTSGSAGLNAELDANYDSASAKSRLTYDMRLERIERLVSDIAGTVAAKGQISGEADGWRISSDATGPGQTNARLSGSLSPGFDRADLDIEGQAQLAVINKMLSPNSITGLARFDLTLNGAPSLEALSGTITTTGASVAIPAVAQSIDPLNASVQLSNGQARIDVTGQPRAGGQFRVSGPVALSAPFEGQLDLALNGLVLSDGLSFNSIADGELVLSGPLASRPSLSGQVLFGETEINLSTASGSISAAPIPTIRHINEPRAQRRTRARAGLISSGGSGGAGPVVALNVDLLAPRRVFARGRGLQAELGGAISIRGTSKQVIPSGQIALIRGTLDLLGRRLALDKGLVTLQGQLEPYLEFLASTATGQGEATVKISGPMAQPKLEIFSTPERPTEEALAMLLFGDKFDDLSPLKLAQLATQLATLNGSGGGATTRLREGLGLDTLDLGTDADGNAQVGVGAYVSDNVYTDVTVNSEGETQLNLNLDVSDTLTIKGSVNNDGGTGLGLYFQKDY